MDVNKLLSKISKRFFWYNVIFAYYNRQNVLEFEQEVQVGLVNRHDILHHRLIKMMNRNFCKCVEDTIRKKQSLQGGRVRIKIVCYLGWFRKQI